MPETLLSISEVLLFGRKVQDVSFNTPESTADKKVTVATRKNIAEKKGHFRIDSVLVHKGEKVLINNRKKLADNGIYTVGDATSQWTGPDRLPQGETVYVEEGRKRRGTLCKQVSTSATSEQLFRRINSAQGNGQNRLLDEQLEGGQFARIYGFAYEGTYYELPNPTLFLVHGEGESATDDNKPGNLASRAPAEPSVSGVAAADYQMSDDIKVWAYDKADFTVRMDVSNGMFEQVLLDMFFSGGDMAIAGAKVSGAKVSGAKVSGAKVSGAKVSGAKVSGAKVSGVGD